ADQVGVGARPGHQTGVGSHEPTDERGQGAGHARRHVGHEDSGSRGDRTPAGTAGSPRKRGAASGTEPMDRAAATRPATDENRARARRLAMVGMSNWISPASPRASASAGGAQNDSTVSAASWEATWPGGHSATKKRVSKRRAVGPGGVIQCET